MKTIIARLIGYGVVGLIHGALLVYWIGLLKTNMQADLLLDSSATIGFVKWLSGWIFLIGLIFIIAWLNYWWSYRNWYLPPDGKWRYWSAHALMTWWAFEMLQWRTEREPELVDENILIALLFSGFLLGFAWIAEAIRLKRAHTILMKERAEAELRTLRSQINPHFLFNALNTIYSQSLGNHPTVAAELVQKLSGILRFALRQSQADYISVDEEIDLLEKYTDLHRARLPAKAQSFLIFKAEWDGEPQQIAPLLLLPFVENAVKYGLHPADPTPVELYLEVQEDQLTFVAKNAIRPELTEPYKGTGQGIENVKKRLQFLYPNRHRLQIHNNNRYFEVQLHISLTHDYTSHST